MNTGFQIRGDWNNPYHLSVGLVVTNGSQFALIKKPDTSVTLPRETMYSQESVEDSLRRGAQEELGITVTVLRFLGTQLSHFVRLGEGRIEKATVYFLCEKTGDIESAPELDEKDDEVLWVSRDDAIAALRQCKNDEALILKRVT